MKGKNTWLCIASLCVLVLWVQNTHAQTATTTIHSAQDGYWRSASSWQEGRVPQEDDVVYISHDLRIKDGSVSMRGLEISSSGRMRGGGWYDRPDVKIKEYLYNQGVIGGYIYSLGVGGVIDNTGLISASRFGLLSGDITLRTPIYPKLELWGDITLYSDMYVEDDLDPQGHSIEISEDDLTMQLKSLSDTLTVIGKANITIHGVEGESIYVAGINAPESKLDFTAAHTRLAGSVNIDTATVSSQVQSAKTGTTIVGDLIVGSTGQIRGESVWVRHSMHFQGSITNHGTFGPHLRPSVTGDFVNLGEYRGQELLLQGDGERRVLGHFPTTVELYGNQTWMTSPSIFTLKSHGRSLGLAQGSTLSVTNISDPLDLSGEGVLQVVNLSQNEDYSPNIQAIDAPEARVVFGASAARLAAHITAAAVEIRDAIQVTDHINITANEVAFIGGSLRGRGSSRNYRVAIDTPRLSGSGHLGPYTDIRLFTDIPQGFSAGWNTGVHLEHKGAGYQGTYRLAGAISDFLSDPLSVLTSSIKPNLRDALNSGTPHYYSYETSRGWSKAFSINAQTNPFNTDSGIEARDFFDISFVSNQRAGDSFELVITTPTSPDFAGQVRLVARRGEIYPRSVYVQNGVWRGEIELFDSGAGQQIVAQGVGAHVARSGRSNYFAITAEDIDEGQVMGVVRESDGSRVDHGSITLTNVTSLEQHAIPIASDGSYAASLSAGRYLMSGAESTSEHVVLRGSELVLHDISLNRVCATSNKTPVLLLPGMMGSDRIENKQIFPELLKYAPDWDSGTLQIHDPGGLTGFGLLTEELEQEGYDRGCTLFHVPYDWSLSVIDSAEQYLKPWIEHAKQTASSTEVDIVAHSMGGLVARAYIQGDSYKDDVRKFAMVGTPNQGSAKSYFAWEGGDPLRADSYDNGFLAGLVGAKNYQTNTINANYQIKTANSSSLCSYGILSLINLLRSNDDVIACDNNAIKSFLHGYAPAAGELYPAYDFLFDTTGDVVEPQFTNTMLRNMNEGAGSFSALEEQNVEVGLFVGIVGDTAGEIETETVDNIVVNTDSADTYVYSDGPIEYLTYWQGDGTVLQESVEGIEYDYVEYFDRPHVSIIVGSDEEIINFLSN